jgi:N-acetylated-alpha-linked acidic dipeptidase
MRGPMRRISFAVLLAFVPLLTIGAAESNNFFGYLSSSSQAERDWETKFRAIPDSAVQREYMQRLSAHPHHVGSPHDKDNA